ncbi:DUF6069 family protein [Intrasporangium sp. DVR]|uniref:DUF6069 family protein n=1 Tax=Intrasporangium sp. DVR TaxID=3127867 RepID=UPI00313A54FC
MSTTSTSGTGHLASPAPGRSARTVIAAGAGIAALVNAGLWLAGRAADVSFRTRPPMTDSDLTVGLAAIVLATVVMFGLGSWLLTRAARRSPRWAARLLVAAAAFAALSVIGPLTTAYEGSSAALLASMHLVTGAVFLFTATRGRGR